MIDEGDTPSRIEIPEEDHLIVHIDVNGYECGGPHYFPPQNMNYWAYCEPLGIWVYDETFAE